MGDQETGGFDPTKPGTAVEADWVTVDEPTSTGESFDFQKPQGPNSNRTVDIQPAWRKKQFGAKTPDTTYGFEAQSPSINQPGSEPQHIADTSQMSDQTPRQFGTTESDGPVYDVNAKLDTQNRSTLSSNTGDYRRSKHLVNAERRQAQADQAQNPDWWEQVDGPMLSSNVPNSESFRATDTQPATPISDEMLEQADTQPAPKVESQKQSILSRVNPFARNR